ncbi:MAG: AlpA family phage regulatory protein [Methylococcales bacterium]
MPKALLLRLPQVLEITSLKRSTFLKLVKDDKFPRPVKLTERSIAWNSDEVVDWVTSRQVA